MKKLFVVLVLSVVLILPLAAGAQGETADRDEILIGAVYPLTGNVAPIGQNLKKGIDFAVEEINNAGGVLGKPIRIVYGDSEGDPKTGMAEAERIITNREVDVMLGSYQSAVTNVVSEVAQRYKIPMLTAISTADAITTRGFEYFFRLPPTNMMYLRDMVQFAYDMSEKYDLGYETVAFIVDNSLLGQETLKWGKYWAEEIGFDIIGEEQYSNNTVDLSSEVLTVKRLDPDILIVDPYISDAILLTRTMHEQGFVPHVMIGKASGLIDPSYIPAVGEQANGISTALEWNTDIPKATEISNRYREVYDINMNGHSAESYTAVKVLAQAIESAGSTDKEAIRQTLEDLVVDGTFDDGTPIILPYDMIDFANFKNEAGAHTNQNKYATITIGQIIDGEYQTVWPFENAATEPITSLRDEWK